MADPALTPTYGGYWAWTSGWTTATGYWGWFTTVPAGGLDPATLAEPGHPYNGNPAPYFDPSHTPDGKKVDNPGYTGEFWPNGTKNDNYVPPDVTPPGLQITPGAAPPITGMVSRKVPNNGSAGAGADDGPPDDTGPYHVRLGMLRDAEISINAAAQGVITAYDALTPQLDAVRSDPYFFTGMAGMAPGNWLDQQLTNSGDILAKNVADTTRLVGEFTKTLNDAGQTYATADRNSFLDSGGGGVHDSDGSAPRTRTGSE